MPIKQVYILISGRVQGVGFRYFALHKAQELNITGWAKNTPDGKVEIEASGLPENLNTFVDWMKIGPARAIIRSFTVSKLSPERKFNHFTIH
jgi:acylphosphatase